jgi:hypothetical protein
VIIGLVVLVISMLPLRSRQKAAETKEPPAWTPSAATRWTIDRMISLGMTDDAIAEDIGVEQADIATIREQR